MNSKHDIYLKTKQIIEDYYSTRLGLAYTNNVLLDGKPFEISMFRAEVFDNYGILLYNDKFIKELVSLYAKRENNV